MTKPVSPPVVTVMMPAWNVEKYIAQAIESVLRQDYRDFELIVLDDCSNDKTYEIAKRYATDPRVRVFRNRFKMRDADNRNKILRLSRGRYVGPQDADDIMLQGRLKKQAAFLETYPEAGVVFGNAVLTDESGRTGIGILGPRSRSGRCRFRSGFVRKLDYDFSHGASLARKKAMLKAGGYEQSIIVGTDTRLYRRMLKQTRFYYLNQLCFLYRQRKNSHFRNYFFKRSAGMWRFFSLAEMKKFTAKEIYVDGFRVSLKKLPEDVQMAIAWRLGYYCERMIWDDRRSRARQLCLRAVRGRKGLSDAEKYREGFLRPLAGALIKQKELLLEAALISSERGGLLLFGPDEIPNGQYALPFVREDYYFHTGSVCMIALKNERLRARGIIDPLIFSDPPKNNRGGLEERLFWNPLLKKHCLNVDLYRTFGVRTVCDLKFMIHVQIDDSLRRAVSEPLTAIERYRICERHLVRDGSAAGRFYSKQLEEISRRTPGLSIRLPERGLSRLPALVFRQQKYPHEA